MFWHAKSRAEERGWPFDLEIQDIVVPEYCPYLGVKLEKGSGKQTPNSPSLDRIDTLDGYVKGNVEVISYRANTIKNNATFEEFEEIYYRWKRRHAAGMRYVVGLLFKGTLVALVEKQRPTWQQNKLNGIGGKIEAGESPEQAMRREFSEEAGADITDWRLFTEMSWRGAKVFFFTSHADAEIRTLTDEVVGWYDIDAVCSGSRIIPNLRWLIPLAQDAQLLTADVEDPS
jgi:8-oxo-dGTP diphosphatase